jgi:cell pole-organizing protein PopZ
MEEILTSIRRILAEEETPSMETIMASVRQVLAEEVNGHVNNNEAVASEDDADDVDDDVLVLDTPISVVGASAPAPTPDEPIERDEITVTHFTSESTLDSGDIPSQADTGDYLPADVLALTPFVESPTQPVKENNMEDQVQAPGGLVSEAAAQDIASKIGSLVRSVTAERAVGVGRPGMTLEDIVREEIRPVLKSWLDTNLPSLVERVVRAEIGRVIDRT